MKFNRVVVLLGREAEPGVVEFFAGVVVVTFLFLDLAVDAGVETSIYTLLEGNR